MSSFPPELRTARLLLRRWRPADREPFAALNADPGVMEFFPARLTREESDAAARRIATHFDKHGFGLWAAELQEGGAFMGFIGLNIPAYETHFTPCVEVGWRLAKEFWNRGYATEGARAAVEFGFQVLGLEHVVSYTAVPNVRSRRVMEKLGMTHDPAEDFAHPLLPAEHWLSKHVLYRLRRSE